MWLCNCYSLNTIASWLVNRKNNRTLCHQNCHLIEKPIITLKNLDAYQNYLGSFWKIQMCRYCFVFTSAPDMFLMSNHVKNNWIIWWSFTFISLFHLFYFIFSAPISFSLCFPVSLSLHFFWSSFLRLYQV